MWTRFSITGLWVGLVTLATFLHPADATARQVAIASLETRFERIREAHGVPGLAIAIVRRDSVVLSKGYGVRQIGRPDPVDAHTLFAIGSTTKAFTAAAIGMLVGEGVLGWDDRVLDRLPGFSLHDPYATAEITIRDLLAHRSGLPPANLMWLTRPQEPDSLVHRLRHLQPVAGFRHEFTYQNLLYVVAGRILEEVTGSRWDGFLVDRILEPLGMSRTNTSLDSLTVMTNVATPHARIEGQAVPVPYRSLDHVGPAGSINSSAADLAHWLRFLLVGGRVGDRRLLETTALEETLRPQIVVPLDPVMTAFHPAARMLGYGMGWFVSDFHGRTLLDHGGGIDGMSALLALVPEEELGVAILTNLQTPTPPTWIYGILYAALDALLGTGPTDWESAAAPLEESFAGQPDAERATGTRTSLSLDRYAGDYDSPLLGGARLSVDRDELVFEFGTLRGSLEHWHHDTFRAIWSDAAWRAAAGPGWITFHLDREGELDHLVLEMFPGETGRFEPIRE